MPKSKKALDRFDTKAKKNMSILSKLVMLIALAIIICSTSIATVSLFVFNKNSMALNKEELNYTADGISFIIEDWKDNLLLYSYIISEDAAIIRAIQDGSPRYANQVANAMAEKFGLDLVALVDKRGRVIGGSGISSNATISQTYSVKKALSGSSASNFEEIGDLGFGITSAEPVKTNGSTQGCIIIGYSLTNDGENSFMDIIRKNYNVECTIFNNNVRAATTLGDNLVGTILQNEAIANQVLNEKTEYQGMNIIAGKQYYSDYSPLADDEGTVRGMLFVAKSMESINKTRDQTLTILIPFTIAIILVFNLITWRYVKYLMWRIKNVTNFLKELETGHADLTKRCNLYIRDEIGDLIIHFDLFLDKLQDIMREVKGSKSELSATGVDLSASMADTSSSITQIIANIDSIHGQISNQGEKVKTTNNSIENISDGINDLYGMIEDQSASVTEASAAIEQMIGNISSVNNSVEKMTRSFHDLEANAQIGFRKSQDVTEKIYQMENESQMLQEANAAISAIASQTNLLAMNAAIEAAHAGDAGKGFAVVADEIRKLSETSTEQSKTIGEGIEKIRTSIATVVSSSTESSEALTTVSKKITETDQLVIQIRAAMDEQNEGSKQIISALRSMNETTVKVHQSSTAIASQKDSVVSDMQELTNVTAMMKTSMDEISAGARTINTTGAALNDISNQVQNSIKKIGSQIDLFTV